jgi:protein involved in polysaccharide export with SLBB domain
MIPNCIENPKLIIIMNLKKLLIGLGAIVYLALPGFSQIEAGKAVNITISGVTSEEKGRIDNTYPVSDSGFINMPFIGAVRAAGLKNDELAASLQARYRSAGIYNNPTIQVISNISDRINEQTIVLGGFVRAPGPKPFTKGLTLYQAIQAAGGASEFGSMKRVKIYRAGRLTVYDLTKSQFMSVLVQPNDTIEVPQKTPFGG